MRFLGIDPSLKSYGWAISDSEAASPRQRLVSSGHSGTLSDMVPVARFMHFRSLVSSLLRRFKVDGVGIESPAYGGGPFSEKHYGLMLYSLEAAFEARKDVVLFDPATLKLLATNDSSATKPDMQKAVQMDTMNPEIIQADEADAYLVAKYSTRFMLLRNGDISPEDLEPKEKHVFLRRTKRMNTMRGKVVKRTAHVFRENSRFFSFSQVPPGDVSLPDKSQIDQELLDWLEKDI